MLARKPVLRRLPALQVTFPACAIGAVACLPFTPGLLTDPGAAPPAAVAGLMSRRPVAETPGPPDRCAHGAGPGRVAGARSVPELTRRSHHEATSLS
ncbi:hypothetical protein HF519_17365 [Pseudonocardia bannensis]|uniref:Uncharacterized protein n=1 Tax=Pseudonocardia bannensis TaxID=630973 RepID=A0A848DL93_9PSEU|nr:hypothetical protein [Pseudonocardia bannensis]NMH93309.1 hypothetical protein [Pseudonocardia bannensis]